MTVSGGAPASDCAFAIGSQIPRIFGFTASTRFASSIACAVWPVWMSSCTYVDEMDMLFGNFARPRASVSAAFLNWLSAAYACRLAHEERRVGRRGVSFTISSPITSRALARPWRRSARATAASRATHRRDCS